MRISPLLPHFIRKHSLNKFVPFNSIHRAAYEDIVKHLERLREERGEDRTAGLDQKPRDLTSQIGTLPIHS